ncbi:MAG: TerB family tellurite resistance protein [Acidobacteriota bacterium]
MGLLDLLGVKINHHADTGSDVESIRRIARQLEEMPSEQARYIAAFAYLLGRVANADMNVSQAESDAMERIIAEKSHLSHDQAVLAVEMAKRQNRLFGHVEDFLVTREFNELATREQKLDLLDCLFAVSAADGGISTREDGEIRQIASELLLEHRDFIDIRTHYRDFLDVLKHPEEE